MRVSIAATTFDIDGYITFDTLPDNTDGDVSRRVTRVTTLDGGVAVTDRGYSEGDRTLIFTWQTVSKEHNDQVERLVRLYPQVNVSTQDGVYLAAPDTFAPGVDESVITLLVIDKVSE